MSADPNDGEITRPVRLGEQTQPVHIGSPSDTMPPAHSNSTEITRPIQIDSVAVHSSTQMDDSIAEQANPDENNKTDISQKEKEPRRHGRSCLILGGIFFILLFAAIGSFLGYRNGMQSRIDRQASQVALLAATQFQLGLEDMANGRFEIAKVRFEDVIRLDPNFPGVREKLAEVMIVMLPTGSPTPSITPTPNFTPTPDTRGEEELYKQIQKSLADKNWEQAITTIESIRTKNLTYKTIDVDGFYYIALRYRGIDKIIRQGDLEGGMYDLALAERFGPLDKDADSYRIWARYYLTGASFWEVDWEKAVYYFGQVYPYLPNMRDSSGIFAIDRYRQAAVKLANQYASEEPCKAKKIFDSVFTGNYRNATYEPLATRVANDCGPDGTEAPKATSTTTLTPSLSVTGTWRASATGATPTPTSTPTLTTAVGSPTPTVTQQPPGITPTEPPVPQPTATPQPTPSPTRP